ncbi:MAG: acylphosphatase [Chloroflexia bacterium]|nr:acylphosphatase [Chloroflexia bacterium]
MTQQQQAASIRVRATITGEVQGVNFRAECREQALQHGLIGWVRNDSDGSVESVFEGSRESVRLILEWCEHGPTGARVRKVATRCEDPTGKDAGFDVRR